MKKFLAIAIMFLFIVGTPALLYADEGAVTQKDETTARRLAIGEKVARGGKNILFGWTELPKQIVDITKESKNPIWGLLAGTYRGGLKAMARTVSGVSDVITAPISPEKEAFIQPDITIP